MECSGLSGEPEPAGFGLYTSEFSSNHCLASPHLRGSVGTLQCHCGTILSQGSVARSRDRVEASFPIQIQMELSPTHTCFPQAPHGSHLAQLKGPPGLLTPPNQESVDLIFISKEISTSSCGVMSLLCL